MRRSAGVLWPAAGQDVFDTGRLDVPEDISLVASHYWWVSWRRRVSTPFRQQVLGHPVTHLTVEDAEGGLLHGYAMPATLVHGLVSTVFTVDLPVAGRVAGLAFRPGGLAALLDTDVRELTDRAVPAERILGPGVRALAEEVLTEPSEAARRAAFGRYLHDLLGPRLDRVREDTAYRTVREAVELMRAREHVTLAPVADTLHVSGRTLQRMFARYVGISPLWVLRRYRLQDATAAIDAGQGQDLAALAASLGFADQAHFTRAFTQVVGVPPSRYRSGSP